MDSDASDDSPRVGYVYSSFPLEILYAFGRVPIRLLPSARNAADAEAYLPKNFCAFAKVTLSSFLDGAARHDLESVVFTDDCDAQRRLNDIWRAYVDIPVLAFLDLPRRTDDLSTEFYAASLNRFVEQLEEQYAQSLSADTLADSIHVYNQQRELWTCLRRAWVAGRLPTARYYELRAVRLTVPPQTANAALTAALEAVEDSRPAHYARLLLMGSHHVHLGLIQAIEEDGRARVVAEDSACDEREVSRLVQADGMRAELLEALAAHYLDLCAPRRRDIPGRLDQLARLVSERRANGVICSYFKFCDLFLAEFPIIKRFFESRHMPVLLLEDEGEPVLSGQARTRLQAFIEMLA